MMKQLNVPPDNHVKVLDGQGWVGLIDHLGTEATIVNAARVSFGKLKDAMDDRDVGLLNYLIENKHTSPLEHVVFTFSIHCPLFVRGQWHRHRTWSYNEISRRYTEIDMEFYTPPKLRRQAESNRQALTALRACAKEADPALIFSGNAGSPRRGAGMREWCLRPAHFADCFDLLICQTGNEPRMIGNASVTRIREMMTCECMNLPLYPLSDGDAGGKHMEPALLLAQLMECRVWGGIPGDRFIMTPRRAEPLNVELREKRGGQPQIL